MWQGLHCVGHARGHRVIHARVFVTETRVEERQVLHPEVAWIAVGTPLPVVHHEKVPGERGLHVEPRRHAQERLGEPCRQRRAFGCRIGAQMRERAQQDEELGGLTVIGQVRLRQRHRLRWRLDKVGVQRRVPGQALALARAEQPRGEGHFQGVVLEKRVGGGFREEGGDARQPFFQRREFPPERYTEPSRCDEPPFAGDESFPSRRRPRQHCGQLGVHRGERLAQAAQSHSHVSFRVAFRSDVIGHEATLP